MRENKACWYLVAYTDQDDLMNNNDRELLSIFALFASIIIREEMQLKNLSRVNRLLKKSTTKLADIETLAALTDMTSGLAHDFNNVIGGIIGRVQLLQLKAKDQQTLRGLAKIEQLAQDGAETVKRIQEFVKALQKLQSAEIMDYALDNKMLKL